MGLDFLSSNGAKRMAAYAPLPPMFDPPTGAEGDTKVDCDYELPPDTWKPLPLHVEGGWRVRDWAERPSRFIDGKDVGETIAWLSSPEGHPVPVRLSQIGGVAVCVADGKVQREDPLVERVVSMVADPFPWDEVESFAAALQEHGFRFLPARAPGGAPTYDFEQMRKAAQNRSNDEMGTLEEAVLARDRAQAAIIDGRLEPRQGGIGNARTAPVAGVIKTHQLEYLHPRGIQVRLQLEQRQRTPLFALPSGKLKVVSWYLRLSGTPATMPDWGIVRVELPLAWYESRKNSDALAYVEQLSALLCEYRTTNSSYGRAAVSLHPIVRAEELLAALFAPSSYLGSHFCRLTML